MIAGRALFIIGVLAFALLAFVVVNQIRKSATEATERRVERGQAGAVVESAKDAIAVQGASAAKERASEELTKQNEKDIRDAEGSNVKVGAGVNAAGLRAVCLRDAYRHTDRCKLYKPAAR